MNRLFHGGSKLANRFHPILIIMKATLYKTKLAIVFITYTVYTYLDRQSLRLISLAPSDS